MLHTNKEFNYMNLEFDPTGTKSIKMRMTIFILHVSNSAILCTEMKYFGEKNFVHCTYLSIVNVRSLRMLSVEDQQFILTNNLFNDRIRFSTIIHRKLIFSL